MKHNELNFSFNLQNARSLFYYCTFFPPAKQDVKKLLASLLKVKSFFLAAELLLSKIVFSLIFNHLHFAFQIILPSLLDFRIYGDTHVLHRLHTICKNKI